MKRNWKEKLYITYFFVSLVLFLGMGDNTQLFQILLIVANFGNSARLLKKVQLDGKQNNY